METTKKSTRFTRFIFTVLLAVAGISVVSAMVMFLWNQLIPDITSLSPITYWQAMGLLILCRILFGGFHFKKHHRAAHQHFENHNLMKEKLMAMNEEERRQFKLQLKQRCCKS